MDDHTASTPIGTIDAGAAIGGGWRFVAARPGVILLWTSLAYTPSLAILWWLQLLVGGEVSAEAELLMFLPLAVALPFAPLQVMLNAAAMRSALQPDDSAFGYVRLGGRELNLATMGWSRGPDNLPMGVIIGLFAASLAIVALQFVLARLGPAIWLAVDLLIAPFWIALIAYVNARSALAGVSAYSGWTNAQGQAWERSRGRVWQIIMVVVGSRLGWLAIAALLAGGAVSVWMLLGLGWQGAASPLLPGLSLPSPTVAFAAAIVSLIGALYNALCIRPTALAWRMLVGSRRDRNFLAEVTG